MEFNPLLLVLLLISNIHSEETEERPKAVVSVHPDKQLFSGETVTLRCEIQTESINNDWTYRWIVEPYNYHRNFHCDTQECKINDVDNYHSGEYRCGRERANGQKSEMSDAVTLTVSSHLPKPTVSVTPHTSVFTGETVILKCEIETQYRSLNWRYQWDSDRSSVSNTINTDTLTISAVTPSDQGHFWCHTEIHGRPQTSQTSSSVYLTVNALPKPTVSVTPDTSVFTGETVILKCETRNWKYQWTYQWDSDRRSVLNSERYRVNRDTLTISAVTPSDQDEFWCKGKKNGRPSSSQDSNHVTLSVKGSKPKAELRSDPEGSLLTGNTVTLICDVNQSTGWKFYWYKNTQNTEKTTTETNSYRMEIVSVSDGGQYWCRAGRGNPVYYTNYSDGLWINVTERLKAVVSVHPDKQLFRGETVTLRCEIQTESINNDWTYRWIVEPYNKYRNFHCDTQECKIYYVDNYHSGKYRCGGERANGQKSEMSDAVKLTVSSHKAETVLSVSPQQWLNEGDSVTLMCDVTGSSTGWTFSWFIQNTVSSHNEVLSDSSRGSEGNYTVSSAAVSHTGVYVCIAERGDPVYHTHFSNTQPLFITDIKSSYPSVSLIISPNRSQHFSSESLSLSCEDHSKSTGWTVRRYPNTSSSSSSSSSVRSTGTGSTGSIDSLVTSDTGVYWCQSESGEKLHPVNISVHHGDVILDSPVHPVTEGDSLTLRCSYRNNPSNLTVEYYKDGSVVQNQTTGDMMIISTISKSHEGFYYCKHPERGASPESWISVTAPGPHSRGLIVGLAVGLSFMFFSIFLVLLWCYRNKKGKVSGSLFGVSPQQNINQTSDTPLQSDAVSAADDVTYADIELKPKKELKKEKAVTVNGSSDVLYSQINVKKKKLKSKDDVSAADDVTYADIELKPKKELKKKEEKKGNSSENEDTVYSRLKKAEY